MGKPLRKKHKAALWTAYVEVMDAASRAALRLADALEAYLRRGFHRDVHPSFDEACMAADAYCGAVRRAEPFHCGIVTGFYSGHVINLSPDELLAMARELRGTAVYHRTACVDGCGYTMAPRYADDGIAGFFRLEVKSMERFGLPRRVPTIEELFKSSGPRLSFLNDARSNLPK